MIKEMGGKGTTPWSLVVLVTMMILAIILIVVLVALIIAVSLVGKNSNINDTRSLGGSDDHLSLPLSTLSLSLYLSLSVSAYI